MCRAAPCGVLSKDMGSIPVPAKLRDSHIFQLACHDVSHEVAEPGGEQFPSRCHGRSRWFVVAVPTAEPVDPGEPGERLWGDGFSGVRCCLRFADGRDGRDQGAIDHIGGRPAAAVAGVGELDRGSPAEAQRGQTAARRPRRVSSSLRPSLLSTRNTSSMRQRKRYSRTTSAAGRDPRAGWYRAASAAAWRP